MRILVADDSQVSRHMLEQQLLKLGYEVEIARDGDEAWQILSGQSAPELAVLDWMMPGQECVDVCRRVREHAGGTGTYTYIILVTMKERVEDMAIGLAAGADDFIAKPYEPVELEARLRVGERVLRFAERLRRANEDLAQLATTDTLTHLYNRGAMLDRLDEEFNRAQRDGRPISVLMIDIDGFKQANDTHGHAAGDAALRMTAESIQAACRIYDTVGRYGGDEFLVALPGADEEAAGTVAGRILQQLGTIAVGEERFDVTVSVGSATWRNDAPHSAQATVRAADAALYRAKREGRNRVVCAQAEEYSLARNTPVVLD
jgi:two-component system chemotaxis response regulator CheY